MDVEPAPDVNSEATLEVEVVYALPDVAHRWFVQLPPDATVGDAVSASGFGQAFPELCDPLPPVGVYGEQATLDQTVVSGDRVEIYRPLKVDPREQRRARASERQKRAS